MNQRSSLVQRAARDFVYRLRVMLGATGEDANKLVDVLDHSIADNVAADVCATLGLDYEQEPGDKRHPWGRRGFAQSTSEASMMKRGPGRPPKARD